MLVSYEDGAASICGGPDCTDRPVTPKTARSGRGSGSREAACPRFVIGGGPWPCYPQVPLAVLAHESSETLVEVASVPPHRSFLLIGR